MSSKAFEKFRKTIKRCESLVESYKTLRQLSANQEGQNVPAPKDIVRSAVVLSVAALDAYVTDVFAEKLVPYVKRFKPDESLIKLLYSAGLDTKEALELLSMERPYKRIEKLISQYYEKHTTLKFEVIDKMFLDYRLKNITDNAAAKSGRKSIKLSVGKLIERRHDIAHSGDYNSHGRIKKINEKWILQRIKNLEMLVTNMDAIICNRIA